ncbi:AAA family ATPase [Acetivibrio straminisolvens]|uniref:AAA family ATPase n=1 Tax=Acetivibrio straminisolvens TaxID=253314 RepID=UPI00223F6C3B|nr:AAA family ATPase [Acetivibrio straminisolvens]
MNKERNIFVITGPCGVGKSTVSHRLAQTLDKSSHINADLIYEMVVGGYEFPWHDEGKLTELLWLNVSSLASNCLDNNFDVVIDYIVFPEHLKYIEKLKCKYNIVLKYVVLMANEDTIRMRDRKRPSEEVMGDRAIEVLNEFRGKKIEKKYILDTSDKSIEDIVLEIKREERFIVRG